jgi:hypothetical protein
MSDNDLTDLKISTLKLKWRKQRSNLANATEPLKAWGTGGIGTSGKRNGVGELRELGRERGCVKTQGLFKKLSLEAITAQW